MRTTTTTTKTTWLNYSNSDIFRVKEFYKPQYSILYSFLKCPSPASISFIFGLFKHIKKKVHLLSGGENPRPLGCESPHMTSGPRLPPFTWFIFGLHVFTKFWSILLFSISVVLSHWESTLGNFVCLNSPDDPKMWWYETKRCKYKCNMKIVRNGSVFEILHYTEPNVTFHT